jgi:hypothetical protein
VSTVFSGLSALVIEEVEDAAQVILVRARTPGRAVACPDCGAETGRVHGYHERTAAEVPVDGRRVLVRVRVRRMRCPVTGCPRQTFREQVPGVIDRYQRRTSRLAGQVSAVARELGAEPGHGCLRLWASSCPGMRPSAPCSGFPYPQWRCRGCWASIYLDPVVIPTAGAAAAGCGGGGRGRRGPRAGRSGESQASQEGEQLQ